ncbi:MAG: hypothetical protein LUF27_13415 [Lachnospiraceae bacterium]|nr:hypothetical protein [Lachnospiraceae bacterium]
MQTKLDQIANQHHMQLLKALLPHLPMNRQRSFSILIKAIEIRNVVDYYNHAADVIRRSTDTDSESNMQADEGFQECAIQEKLTENTPGGGAEESAGGENPSALLDILADIRQYCDEEDREMIDQVLQMISMIELYKVCAESAS